ncbi:helix-turn-helix transcriptional regulator [Ornithinibacillus sp. JPR2-1]|uniref:helix-turn-helix domain-containing protein n=1 Tax=Ornithinibacillus sp. JPR2-1 TaxID=2094019 RepID=UPI0031D36F28
MQLDGQTLRQMRKRRGMSQDALSRRLHMSRSNISKLESGKLEIRGKDLLRWVQETNSLDMLIAITAQVDLSAVADVISQLSLLAGTILIGWCF